jgi:threonine dehydrogenase-like Zn-dependent dehydrogenase
MSGGQVRSAARYGREESLRALVITGPRAAGSAVALVEPGGRLVFIGISGAPSLIDTRDLVLSDITAAGILGASAGLAPAVEHYAEGRVDPSRLAAVTVGLEHAPDALAGRVSTGSGTKVHIDPYA